MAIFSDHQKEEVQVRAAGAEWLCLAAAPVFAAMAVLTQINGGADMICSSSGHSPIGGMAVMYLLMSAFHSPPWIRLAAGRRKERT